MWQPREKPFQEGAASTTKMGVCLGCFGTVKKQVQLSGAGWRAGADYVGPHAKVMLRILSFTLNSLPLIFVGSMARMKMEARIPCL